MRACVFCASWRVPLLQTRTGARRRSGADFDMFAAAVCVQVMRWLSGPVQKLPPPMAEAMTMSGACMRALSAIAGESRRFQTRIGAGSVRAHILACLLLLCA